MSDFGPPGDASFPPPPPPAGAPFPQPNPYGGYPPLPQTAPYYLPSASRTSGLAIASMVLGILWLYWIGSILAVIFGHIALGQTSRDRSLGGRGMAIAGIVLGYVGLGLLALVILVAVAASA